MFAFPNNFFSSSSSSSSYPNNTLSSFLENDFPNNTTSLLDHDSLLSSTIPFTSSTHHDNNIVPLFHHNQENANFSDCNNIAMFEQDSSNFGGILPIPNFVVAEQKQLPSTAAVINNGGKKDRHSKIHTSQGLRDRRVRLSSEIARKFFDLQDMLEFDKPSNTLEWLFTQSNTAIKELARTKNGGFNNNNNIDNNNNNNGLFDSNSNKSFSGGGGGGDGCSSKGRKLKWTQKEETKKESRERARARARERTCYKMCSGGRMQEEVRYPTTTDSTTHQQMLLQQLMSSSTTSPVDNTHETEAYARWRQLLQLQTYNNNSSLHNHNHHHLLDSEIARDHGGFNVNEESIMIKRNLMSSSSSSQYQHYQNLIPSIPKELPSLGFNNNINDLFPPNWETNGGCSNFCGIATMNLSTCFMNQWC